MVAVRDSDSLGLDSEPCHEPLEVFLEAFHPGHELNEGMTAEVRPIVALMEREARVTTQVSHLFLLQEGDPIVEIIPCTLQLTAILLHLSHDEFLDPRCLVVT